MSDPVQITLPSMAKMLRKIPAHNNDACWKAIDNCIFFLTIEGILSDSEVAKARARLIKKCHAEGIILTPSRGGQVSWTK